MTSPRAVVGDHAGESKCETLWQRHKELYSQALRGPPADSDSTMQVAEPLNAQIEELLSEIGEVSARSRSLDEYRWAEGMLSAWQAVYSTVLNRPMPIPLERPKHVLVADLPPVRDPGRLYSEEEFRRQIDTIAGTIASTRISILGRCSSDQEMRRDWSYAETYLAGEILDGKINLPKRIGRNLYGHLERIWIKYVKCLWAFFNWVNRGRPLYGFGDPSDYRGPCAHLQSLLVNARMKASVAEFEPIRSYLRDRYLDSNGKVDLKKPHLRALVETKANRIYGLTRDSDSLKNWLGAEAYVQLYYENIIDAVETADEERTLRVLKAFQFSKAPENGFRVINCFEVAIAIYFLDPDVITMLWQRAEHEELPASHVQSSVGVATWPDSLTMPSQCEGRCEYRGGKLLFRGVMTESQHQSLLGAALTHEQADAVEKLFKQSRLIHRETTL